MSCGWCCGRAWCSRSPGSASVLLASVGVDAGFGAMFAGGVARRRPTDVVAFALVAASVLAVTLLAAYLPARRASRINPTDALRYE